MYIRIGICVYIPICKDRHGQPKVHGTPNELHNVLTACLILCVRSTLNRCSRHAAS